MTTAIEEVATNANHTADESQRTHGAKKVDDSTQAIETLSGRIQSASTEINQLVERVKDITGVLDVIRGIAEQTNLLALNAAIEAARAGESGRGFAVVADEARSLAHRTAESTKESSALQEISDLVSKINERNASVASASEQQAQVARDVDRSLVKIRDVSSQNASGADQTSASSRELARQASELHDVVSEFRI
ncbi:methyl-accepting chemotaxis protein [Natronospirillum operosum]|uniref:methyl-accepting chemotaxis protein n=1 Tax=Natronospirillum operosum TaxID=2759953 RepID=UPI001F106131|nr:methyl-accepting chemotaxis protein [Natronospirillum operosum]